MAMAREIDCRFCLRAFSGGSVIILGISDERLLDMYIHIVSRLEILDIFTLRPRK